MKHFSLRWLLLGTVLGAIIVAFSGFAIYLDRVEQGNRLDDIDTELVRAERAGTPGPQLDRPGPAPQTGTDEPNATDPPIQLLLSPDGIIITESGAANPFSDATLTDLATGGGNITISNPRYRALRTVTPDGFVAVTALSLDDFDSAVNRFRTTLAVGGGVILVLVAAILWVLTGILLRPVARMADVANRIADGDLETPVGQPSGTRETVDLAVDLDQMVSRLRGALNESNRSREATERLMADMAHEIRTPLTALKGYSDLYAKGMLETSGDVDRAMSRIGSESERLSTLANAMLQLAQDGTAQPEIADFDVAAVVEEVVADLRAAYPDHRIEFDIDRSRPLMVSGSRDRLQQAVLNLGSNACHHNPPGETIAITARLQTGAIRISVADNGPGVDPNDRDRIFLPFFRSDAARNRDGQHGAGLGLALAQQIAEQHHGTLSVESTPGGGATFILAIPALSKASQP